MLLWCYMHVCCSLEPWNDFSQVVFSNLQLSLFFAHAVCLTMLSAFTLASMYTCIIIINNDNNTVICMVRYIQQDLRRRYSAMLK